ncbi:YeeE/YedE family protein [Hansschlegelia sp. KR7-227]|uniref:YeeE/YedE family protein n=1 Tax=Hansschlegelia sp. KR7-227 TaxID=3400914 RepID=UPI003C0E2C09
MAIYWPSLLGGAAIGLSATLLMLLNGRVAGVSGILSGVWRAGTPRLANLAFVAGLVLGPLLYRVAFGGFPDIRVEASLPVLVLAGLLVGYGTRLGSGCTSGHGVVGLARLSPRSIAAVAVFLGTAIATVAVMRLAGAS